MIMKFVKTYRFAFLLFFLSSTAGYAQEVYSVDEAEFSTPWYHEYSPFWYGDRLVFCSSRKSDFLVTYEDIQGRPLYDLYQVSMKNNRKWTNPEIFDKRLRTPQNEGPAVLNREGNLIIYTRNYRIKKVGNIRRFENRLGLYSAELRGDKWTRPGALAFCKRDYNYMHPALSIDGQKLYFASDMPGGYGGFDLYVCNKRGDGWGEPGNLGPEINTEGDEVFPCVHSSGRLYFSSSEHNSAGRLDIFYTVHYKGKWMGPVRLETPFNTVFDDFSLVADSTFEQGYFTSRRRRTDDIYRFSSVFPVFDSCTRQEENNYCYEFFETGTMDIDTTNYMYEWDMGDGTKIRSEMAEHCFDTTGEYIIKLNVIDQLTGEVMFNQATYFLPVENIRQVYISAPDTVFAGDMVHLDGEKTNLDFTPENYYWNFGDFSRSVDREVTHSYLLPGSYRVSLGVTSGGGSMQSCSFRKLVVIEPAEMATREE